MTGTGELKGRFIETVDSIWSPEEKALVSEVWMNTSIALEEAGYDSQKVFSGYRFRRYRGQYVDGKEGRIALVRHHKKEIILADAAFLRLQGFYIYHELGHVADKHTDREINRLFHEKIGSKMSADIKKTADGFWLNGHAHHDYEEATADAFALWVIMNYTDNYRPVFAGTPVTTDYEKIIDTFDSTITQQVR
jgi:hypothetical protein